MMLMVVVVVVVVHQRPGAGIMEADHRQVTTDQGPVSWRPTTVM